MGNRTVRVWLAACLLGVAAGPAPGQQQDSRRVITVREAGRAPRECVLIVSRKLPDGSVLHALKDLKTGEIVRVTEPGGAKPASKPAAGGVTAPPRKFAAKPTPPASPVKPAGPPQRLRIRTPADLPASQRPPRVQHLKLPPVVAPKKPAGRRINLRPAPPNPTAPKLVIRVPATPKPKPAAAKPMPPLPGVDPAVVRPDPSARTVVLAKPAPPKKPAPAVVKRTPPKPVEAPKKMPALPVVVKRTPPEKVNPVKLPEVAPPPTKAPAPAIVKRTPPKPVAPAKLPEVTPAPKQPAPAIVKRTPPKPVAPIKLPEAVEAPKKMPALPEVVKRTPPKVTPKKPLVKGPAVPTKGPAGVIKPTPLKLPRREPVPAVPVSRPTRRPVDDGKLLTELKEALRPSLREAAAEKLGRSHAALSAKVESALIEAAGYDPAPSVRAACLRVLRSKGVRTAAFRDAVLRLFNDDHPLVKKEVRATVMALARK